MINFYFIIMNEIKSNDEMLLNPSSYLSNIQIEITPKNNNQVYLMKVSIKGILKKRQLLDQYHVPNRLNASEDDKYEPSVRSSSQKIKSDLFNIENSNHEQKGNESFSQLLKIASPQSSQQTPHYNGNSQDRVQEPSSQEQQQEEQNLSKAWQKGALRIIYYITKFIRQIKTHASLLKFKLLTEQVLDFIDDKASDIKQLLILKQFAGLNLKGSLRKQISIKEKIYNYFDDTQKFISNYIPVIEPDSYFKVFWDMLVVLLVIINIFFIPMKLAFSFSTQDNELAQLLLETIPSWVFVADILFSFNTAYYSKGVIHRHKRDIIQFYLQGNFWWDIIVVIPFILSQFKLPHTQYTLLLRTLKIRRMTENLEEVINLKENIQAFLELIKSVYFIIFVAHFCACAWYYIGEIQISSYGASESWLTHQGIYDASWTTKYIYSFYFSTITTLTIGYGDIGPVTDAERIFVVIVALIICGVFGYTISSIGEIFRSLQEKQQLYKAKLKYINQYLKKKQLNKQLQLQVRKYFEYLFKLESDSNQEAEELMQSLNKNLKEKVQIDMYYKVLMKSRIIRENLSKKSVQQLCNYVKEKKYVPEEYIFMQGDVAKMLICIQKGEISFYADQIKETLLKTYKQGQFIAEKEFAIQQAYEYSAKASKFTQIIYLTYDDFFRVLIDNNEMEKFCMIRDNLIFNENYRNFGLVCEICNWTHKFSQFNIKKIFYIRCPFVFLQVNNDKLINKLMTNIDQNRKRYSRKRQWDDPTLRNLMDQQDCVLFYILNNKIISEIELTDQYLVNLGFKLENENQEMTKSLVARSTQQRISNSNQGTQISDSSGDHNKLFEKYFSRNDSVIGSEIQPSDVGTAGKLKLAQEENLTASPRTRRVKFSFENSNDSSDPKSIQSPFHRQLQRKNLSHNETLISIQAQLQEIKSFSRLDSNKNDQVQSQRNVNFLRKTKKEDSVFRKSIRIFSRRNSQMTNKSIKNEPQSSQKYESQEEEVDGISTKFSWIHKHCDFDELDKQQVYEIYFPEFNMPEILLKLQAYLEEKQRNKQMENKLLSQLQRSRTSKIYSQFKSVTLHNKTNKGSKSGSPVADQI